MTFPDYFTWGAATASYQIEGAAFEDGRGPSVWDMLCRKPGAIWNGQSGDVACDHYHRWRDDVGLMQSLGLRAYRLSLSWPRLIPGGVGAVNEKGIAFYDRLIDALLEARITPYVTLFHWDFPYELFCRGGWLNRDSAQWFADYTALVADRFSDRVTNWITLNEPQCYIGLGHATGRHAPGLQLPPAEVLRAAHNTMLAHGRAVQTLRARAKRKCHIGYAPVGVVRTPLTESASDIEAARSSMFAVADTGHWNNTWWLDPLLLGRYPEDGLRLFGKDAPKIESGDMAAMSQSLDFLGTNIYSGQRVKAGADGKPETVTEATGHPLTAFHWLVMPDSLRWGPRLLYEKYKLPIYVTENGLSCLDWVSLDGQVRDPQRIDFTRRYLTELGKAMRDGAEVRGYFHWSLMDNFEWAEGYRERFGLVHVDFATGKRTPKDSASWYAQVIRSNGQSLGAEGPVK